MTAPAAAPFHREQGRDRIRPVDQPRFARPGSGGDLPLDEDRVVGVRRNGIARAYPVWILSHHEIVNDEFAGAATCVTYCPISGSAAAFDARMAGAAISFGNDGPLRDGNLVLYDRRTGSLWQQLQGVGLDGPLQGRPLARLPARVMRWDHWRALHPDTEVLSGDRKLGLFYRALGPDNERENAEAYLKEFPIPIVNSRFEPMRKVVGFRHGTNELCLPLDAVQNLPRGVHSLGRADARIVVDERGLATFVARDGSEIPSVEAYWFAWQASFPAGEVLSPDEIGGPGAP